MARLTGRVALVTGAGRGIGLSLVNQLAKEGALVVINDLDEAPAAEAVASIKAAGGNAVAVVGSVSGTDFPERFVSTALEKFGAVDILINNAGYVWNSRIENTTDEQWDAMHDVHLKAPFRIARRVVQHWKSPKGGLEDRYHRKIVNVSSVAGTHGMAGQLAYSAAKAGLIGMTLTLARELGPLGVNVNAVAFGLIETRLTQEIQGETEITVAGRLHRVGLTRAALDDLHAHIGLRRGGSVQEAAGAMLLLCLPESDYISGQVVDVDGGGAL